MILADGKIGRSYNVFINDCCVNATFSGILVRLSLDEDGDVKEAIFDNGISINGWACILEELSDGENIS